ncbi:hypothetical protein Tco_1171561 [Tanacetum coccineum]
MASMERDRLLVIEFGFSFRLLRVGERYEGVKVCKTFYTCSDSLLLTPLCCDDIHEVTPRVFALAGCDRLVSEPLVIENYVSLIRKKFYWGTIFPIGLKRYRDPKEEPIEKEPLMELKEIGTEKLENEMSLEFTVQSLIKERDNVKIEYQKLFDSIKKTRFQTQKEIDELVVHVSEKTYAYGAIRAENQNLLSTISELKTRLEKVEKSKSVNTKLDKTNGSQSLLCVTPLNKHDFLKKTDVPKTEENHVVSKPATLQTSPTKQTSKTQMSLDQECTELSQHKNHKQTRLRVLYLLQE